MKLNLLLLLLLIVGCNNHYSLTRSPKEIPASGTNCPYQAEPQNYDEIMDRIHAMRVKSNPDGCLINLKNADLSVVWGEEAMKERIFVKMLGYASADDFAQNDPEYGGHTDYDDLLSDLGYSTMAELDYNEFWFDPYMPTFLSWKNVDVTGATFPNQMNLEDWTGENDYFSSVKGVEVSLLNSMIGKLPPALPEMDVSGLTVTGLSSIDFSRTTGLTVGILNAAPSISSIKLPEGFDVTGLTHTDLFSVDFRGTTGLTVAMLNSATSLLNVKLPNMDVTGFSNSYQLVDFSEVSGLTVAMLNAAPSLQHVKLPAMDVTGLTQTDILGMDFTNVTGLTVAMLNASNGGNGLQQTKLPVMDLTGLTLTNFTGTDFRNVTGLTLAMLNGADTLMNSILPAMSVSGLTQVNLSGADFSRTTGLTVGMLNASPDISQMILPQMDVGGLTHTYLYAVNFSNTSGLTVAHLNNATNINALILPAMNVTGMRVDALTNIDFTKATGFEIETNSYALQGFSVKLPTQASIDLSGIDFKDARNGTSNSVWNVSRFTTLDFENVEKVEGFDFR